MQRKKVALAVGGAGARAVILFGILDVLKENNIPIDYISACSSSSLIACSYSCGTDKEFKKRLLDLNSKDLFFKVFAPSFKGGLFSLNGIDNPLREFITVENMEELPIPVAIVAADIVHGEEVIFTMGDIFRAIRASCTMPGLFEPVVWGEKILLDGGLFSIIPVEAAQQFDADVIIGMDLSTNDRIFDESWLIAKRGWNFLTKPLRYLSYWNNRIQKKLWPRDEEIQIDQVKVPSMLRVMDKALDYAMTERRKGEYFNCDIIIKPDMSGFGDMDIKKDKSEIMYEEGRRVALMALPRIREILAS